MRADEFESTILKIYLDDQEECNARFGYPMHCYMDTEKLQKIFWRDYRLNRKEFLIHFEHFFKNQPIPEENETYSVSVAGGPVNAYKKSNWINVDGRHYVCIKIRLGQYLHMRQRGMTNAPRQSTGSPIL
jgi:hypothetical protein